MNALLLLGPLTLLGADDPFADLDHETARAKALAETKLLFIDFTAEWCGPCKRMDRETWADAGVKAWLGEYAIAIQVDVDEEPEVARRFAIEAMPTVVALRGGEEFDRSVGFLDAPGFLKWARDVHAGKRSIDAILEKEKGLRESADVDARYDLARSLLRQRRYDLALEHYLWLWPATRGTSYDGVRLSFMLSDVRRLMEAHEPARKAFMEILEEIQERVAEADVPTFYDWAEWTALCKSFGMNARVLRWYEERRDEQGVLYPGVEGDVRVKLIRDELFELLLENDRSLDAVRVLPDPVAWTRGRVAFYVRDMMPPDVGEEERAGLVEYAHGALRNDASRLYGALLLANRVPEAEQVARVLIEALDTPESRIALVRGGLRIAQRAEPGFATWLDEAEAAGARVDTLREWMERIERDRGRKMTRESLERLTTAEIWRLGVERFGWHGEEPAEDAKARLIRHFLQDQRIEDHGDFDDPEE